MRRRLADGSTLTWVREALGSVRAEVSAQGVIITKAFRYAAYGEIVQPNANTPTLLGGEKHRVSHRGAAVATLRAYLGEEPR